MGGGDFSLGCQRRGAPGRAEWCHCSGRSVSSSSRARASAPSRSLWTYSMSQVRRSRQPSPGTTELTIPVLGTQRLQQVLRLHVDGGGLSTPNDPRTLNFRVFRVSWASDAAPYDAQTLSKLNASRYRAGRCPEGAREWGCRSRWFVSGTRLVSVRDVPGPKLPLGRQRCGSGRDLADGARAGAIRSRTRPGWLAASSAYRSSTRATAGGRAVGGRQLSSIVLPIKANTPAVFKLHVDGGGHPTPNDPRVLNFRIFGFGWVDTGDSEGR